MRTLFLLFSTIGLAALILVAGCSRLQDLDPEQENRYDDIIRDKALKYNLEPELLKAVIWKESRFDAEQVGGKGEIGLMQLLKPAVSDWAKATKSDIPSDQELFTPKINIEIGAWYLGWCYNRFSEYNTQSRDVLCLAIYNAGIGRVRDKWLPESPQTEMKLEDITYPSTRDYISKILTRKLYYKKK